METGRLETHLLQEVRARLKKAIENAVLPEGYSTWKEVAEKKKEVERLINQRYIRDRGL
jgi:uncharacterized protein YktA (UPF0223 family)